MRKIILFFKYAQKQSNIRFMRRRYSDDLQSVRRHGKTFADNRGKQQDSHKRLDYGQIIHGEGATYDKTGHEMHNFANTNICICGFTFEHEEDAATGICTKCGTILHVAKYNGKMYKTLAEAVEKANEDCAPLISRDRGLRLPCTGM